MISLNFRRPACLRALTLGLLGLVALLTACSKPEAPATTTADGKPALKKVTLQTDWYAQAEHGGYYQALANGYYAEAGLDVTIEPGGPGSFGVQKVASGASQFSMGRSDDVMLAVQEGLPLLIVTALMQHDPQALLLHDETPVKTFADLDGKNVMATPGAAWIQLIEKKHGIKLNIIPLNYGLAQFMADKGFIQQCFVTNEPYYVTEAGHKPRTLLIAGSGYDPYRVIFSSARFIRENPETVRAFAAASARGWDDFLSGDASPGKALIAARNEKMTDAFMDYSIAAMKKFQLVSGDPALGERTGLLDRTRLQQTSDLLHSIGLIRDPMPVDKFATLDFNPPAPAAP
jgi:NitT/TauT family transport system substrate-binding protein